MKGFFNINKPRGMNSTKVVAIIKRLTHEKVGHLGTLDPDAHGVLPIAVGKATRLFDFFLNKDKVYEARGRFGILTDTLDESGRVVLTNDVRPTRAQLEAVLPLFCGKQMQMPPIFSAKQVDGERAYDKARRGEEVTLSPREICVYSLELLSFKGDEFSVRIHCSAGTYVRALIRDIAEKLGAIATTIDIFRTRSGAFDIASSTSIDDIEQAPPPWGRVGRSGAQSDTRQRGSCPNCHCEERSDVAIPSLEVTAHNCHCERSVAIPTLHLISIEDALSGQEKVRLTEPQVQNLLCGRGQSVPYKDAKNVLFLTPDGDTYGLGNIENGQIRITAFLLD